MTLTPWLRNTGLGLCIAALSSPAAFAQSTGSVPPESLSADQCALLENGLRRLACFDRVFGTDQERQSASEGEQEQAEEAVSEEMPLSDRDSLEDSGLAEDDGSVMNSLLEQYVATEKAIFSFSGSFVGHRPTYILPITWADDPNTTPESPRLGATGYDYELRHEEAKYQISFKVPLLTGLLEERTTLWFGYTQQSYWQVYNRDDSAPFRETNYEPEIFLRYQTDWDLGPGTLNGVTIGFNHQSNGQSEPRSRSWNRIVGGAAYSYGRWLFLVQPWYRIPENSNDDNADIERYLGHANYQMVYKLTEDRTFSLKLMNNLRSDNRTSIEFGYSFPMGETLKGFFQYYNGYGESLIDYNHRIERFGIGIMLNDWL